MLSDVYPFLTSNDPVKTLNDNFLPSQTWSTSQLYLLKDPEIASV